MNWRLVALSTFSTMFTAVCLYLGFWQLGRNAERRPLVEEHARTFAARPVSFDEAAKHRADLGNSRVILSGRYDLAHEIILVNRTRHGAPGVLITTPLIRDGNDTAVLVNRGWVYSPDGASAPLANWRVGIALSDSAANVSGPVTVMGLALDFADSAGARALSRDSSGAAARVSRMSHSHVAAALPYPLARMYVQVLPVDTTVRPGVPIPLPAPVMSSSQHVSYAIQWFSFAAIAIVGTVLVIRQSIIRAKSS